MIVVGIDPSLTATGIAVIDTEDQLVVPVFTVTSAGKTNDSLTVRRNRLGKLVHAIDGHCLGLHNDTPRADLVVIESPSLGQQRQAGTLDRAGLWWLLTARLIDLGFPVVTVAPAGRAKYATGKGNATKDTVLLHVARRYPHVDVQNNNEADALVLAAMGARHVGQPIDEMPKSNLAAMDAVAWPQAVA